jgi:AraC-like DNA-binding protein
MARTDPLSVVARDTSWLIWRVDSELVGVLVRDALEASDAERLAAALEQALNRPSPPLRLFIDALDLDNHGCGVVAAEILWDASRRLAARHRFVRIAMAHARGASGALIAGWTKLLGGAWPTMVSPALDEVLSFVASQHLAARIIALRAESHDALMLGILRALRTNPRIRLDDLAHTLGVAVAHLRAHFAQRGTTFREEALRRRLDVAREALAEPTAKLEAVALEAGFNSGSHLATALKRRVSRPEEVGAAAMQPTGEALASAGTSSLARPPLVDLATFIRAPLGNCHVSTSWLIWGVDESLAMCSVFGPMGEKALTDLFAGIDAVMHCTVDKLDVLSDATLAQIKDVGSVGLSLLYRYTNEHKDRLSERIRHHAITATETPGGAFLGGLGEINEARHPWRVMSSIEEALAWFGREDRAQLARALADLIADARRGGALILQIRERLRRSPSLSINELARPLGMSVRALQRACKEHGTSFREIQRETLLERARELLLDSELKIAGIAHELGLRSRSHFVALFRDATGMSPSAFRLGAGRPTRDD